MSERDRGADASEEVDTKIPWHFWILVSLGGIYLAYRFVQVLILAVQAIF